MLTHDLNVSVGRPYTTNGIPEVGGPIIDGVIQTEAEDFLQVEAGQYLAFD
jgi:hypothetical protein